MDVVQDDIAGEAFDEAVRIRLAEARRKFVRSHGPSYFSEETTASLHAKALLVKGQMDQGVGFSEACDSPDVYLGYLDRQYLHHYFYCNEHEKECLDLETFRKKGLVADALSILSRSNP